MSKIIFFNPRYALNMAKVNFKITSFVEDILKESYEYRVEITGLNAETSSRGVCCNFTTNSDNKWEFWVFPSGRHEIYQDFLSVSVLQQFKEEVEVEWEISVLTQNGEKFRTVKQKEIFRFNLWQHFDKLISRNQLLWEPNNFVTDGKLVLEGKITMLKCDGKPRKYSDIALEVQGKLVHTHRVLLIQNSPVFKQLLTDPQNQSFLELGGVDFAVAEQMANFLFEEKINDPAMAKYAKPLMNVAIQYNIAKLKAYCQNYLIRKLTVYSVVDTLEFSIQSDLQDLLTTCIKFIGKNSPKIPTRDWTPFIKNHPSEFDRLFQHCVFENYPYLPKKILFSTNQKDCKDCKFGQDFSYLFPDGPFPDAEITVNGRILKVHKLILASRSTVFKEMFDTNMHLKSISLDYYDFELVQEALRYVYCEKVENLEKNALNLMPLAKRLNLQGLVDLCGKTLEPTITVENVMDLLSAADTNRCPELKQKCITFFAREANVVMQKKCWKDFVKNKPDVLGQLFHDWTKRYFRSR